MCVYLLEINKVLGRPSVIKQLFNRSPKGNTKLKL